MRRAFALLLVQVGCLSPTGGLPLETSESSEGVSTGSTSVVVVTSTSGSTSTSTSTGVATSGGEDGGSAANTESFIVTPDGGGLGDECDVAKQNCPEGQKCSWVSSGSSWFDHMGCVPLVNDPRPAGAECMYHVNLLDGIDDCAAGAICLDLGGGDADGTGICKQMCLWDVLDCPVDMVCVGSRTWNWCEPVCDLLAQDCPEGERCDIDSWAPLCEQDWPEEHPQHGVGESCEYAAQCELGATCIAQATIECEFNCCTPFCERGKAGCPLPGQGCIEPYEGWDDETGWDEVGVCRVVNP